MSEPVPVPTLVRLEYLTPEGWAIGAKSVNLLHPERYVERLAARGKIGRVTELDDQLQPTGQVWGGESALPSCVFCSHRHPEPYDGSCLI